ncbi:hypothetical protein SLL00_03445 [Metabacillus indicus]|uniref:hypothetical protein n=1 Tax=Metabacillus indicus TaxID=246786 RepID=UPI002A07A444|nr:hypothetical protein [Metabacillus indicus]MDX8288828.1 hypothetical protein [Metabacillus indicus]
MSNDQMYIYLNVDEEGNVTQSTGGSNPVPEYDFFFIRDKQTLDNISKFRVVINGFKPDLVLKEGETLEEIKTSTIVEELMERP